MHRAAVFIHYELMDGAGMILPSRMAAEVAVTGRWGSAAAGTAFARGRGQAYKSFCSVSGYFWGEPAISRHLSGSRLSSNSVKTWQCC